MPPFKVKRLKAGPFKSPRSWGGRWRSECRPAPGTGAAHPGRPAPAYPPYDCRSGDRCPPVPARCGRGCFAGRSFDHGIAGIEVELHSMALLVKGPAAALGIAGRVYIEPLAPGAGIFLQFQQRFQRLFIALHGETAHQVGCFAGILRGQQRMDQTVPHIGGSVTIDLAGPKHLCGQRRPLDLRG